jgi:hypothetical protein
VLLEECDVPARSIGGIETLLDIQWVSLYADWDTGIQRILDVIQPIPPEVQKLLEALDSDDVEVRIAAAKALANIAHPGSVTALIEALHDEDIDVRLYAVSALRSIGTPEALEAIKQHEKRMKGGGS